MCDEKINIGDEVEFMNYYGEWIPVFFVGEFEGVYYGRVKDTDLNMGYRAIESSKIRKPIPSTKPELITLINCKENDIFSIGNKEYRLIEICPSSKENGDE